MLTFIVLLVFAGTVVFDLLPLKKRPKKQNAVYLALLSAGFIVLMLYSLGVEVPSPAKPITALVKMLFMPD